MITLREQWQVSGSAAESYERFAVGRLFRQLAERFLEGVPLKPGDRVLDVACGTGIVARVAAPRVAPSGKVVGFDLNEGMLAVARACSAEEGTSIAWKQGDATALPFADGEFDVVLCQQGLQFVPDKARALAEMRRVVAPGGVIALGVFGAVNRFDGALAEALAEYVDDKVAKLSLARFALGDLGTLRPLLEQAGLDAIDVRTVAITRQVLPTQEWLLECSAGVPFGADIAAMEAPARAAMVREIAAKLKDLWVADRFEVPTDVHLVYARRPSSSARVLPGDMPR
jgi:ubiquinone/menaquinone biosynthesis C-methylase UbiE